MWPTIYEQVLLYPTTRANFDTLSYCHFGEGCSSIQEDMHRWSTLRSLDCGGLAPADRILSHTTSSRRF